MTRSNYHSGKKQRSCYFCGCGPPLDEHHVIPQRFGGPDSKDNIVELCQLCHQRLEKLYDKSFFEWFGIDDENGSRQFHRPCQNYDCDNQAEVKAPYLHHQSRFPKALMCAECAIKAVAEDYLRLMKKANNSSGIVEHNPPDSVIEHWDEKVKRQQKDIKYKNRLKRTYAMRAMQELESMS